MNTPFVLSQTVEYALRATLYIARRRPDPIRIPEVARAVHAPPKYLAKILGQLARAGILNSTRGPAGGFRLALGDERASLASIVAVFENAERHRCLLGHGICGQNPSCTVHEKWSPIARSASDFFANTTIADLLSRPGSSTTPS